MRDRFWETVPLADMTHAEWEALCDGCGKCCLNKIEYEDTGEVEFTRVACKLLDGQTCRCRQYARRLEFVPDCVQINPSTLPDIAYWLPRTCAYRRLHQGKPLYKWHPLISGNPNSVHKAGKSVRGWTIPETEIDPDDLDTYVIAERP
jgi:uncharacterized cysteine cluster protein YcgN (CxxCxxCC family)